MVVGRTRIHGLEKLSPMDCWNPHTPSLWDWENPLLINGKACETPKQCWGIEGDGGLETGSGGYSPVGCGRSGSDLVNGSSSKSSISASIDDSQSNAEVKASELNFQTIERFPDDFDKNKELPPGEPLIGLKLGRRTYFEDIFTGNTVKSSSLSLVQSPTDSVKKARLSCHSMQNPLCQVEGCNVDLSGAKDYHRRHRVCENHSKCPKVIVSGMERRFCQQCSRFHELSEFDEKKRSCRRRLSDHNARRRKPQTSTISFSSARLPSSFHVYADGRQQMNLLLNKVPLVHTSQANITWENSCDFKLSQAKGSCLRTAKGEGIDGHLHLPNLEFSNAISTLRCHDFDKLLSFKGATAEVPNQGLEASMMTSNLDSTPDIRSALSLLSTSNWGLSDQESASLDQIMQVNHTSVAHPTMHTNYQGLPLSSSETLQAEHPSAEPQVSSLALHNNGGQFQEFQLFKEPFESAFFDNNHIH